MKRIMTTLAVLSTSTVFAQATLEQRVDQLESLSFLEAIQWSGQFNYRYDGISSETSTTKKSFNPMRVGVTLDANTKSDENSKVQFFSRFGLTKFVNDLDNQAALGDDTFSGSRAEKSGFLRLDRAFVNYNLGGGFVLSVGRLPTTDGNPVEMWDGAPRQGTYPMLAYGAMLDGVAATYNLGFVPNDYKVSTRIVYTPIYNINLEEGKIPGGQIASPVYAPGKSVMTEQAALVAAMLEVETSKFKALGNFSFIGQMTKGSHFKAGDGVSRGTSLGSVLKSPAFGGNGTAIDSTTAAGLTGCTAATGSGGLCDTTFSGSTLSFDFDYIALNTSFMNIADTNLSFAVTYLHGEIESKGYLESNSTLIAIGNQNSTLADALGIGRGVMTNTNDKKTTGDMVLATLTYKLPVQMMKNPLVGAEFLHGSRGAQFFGFASDSLTAFYQTRGDAFHFFWAQPLESGLNLRVGYQMQDHKWTKGYIGAPTASTLEEKTMYANLRYTF